MIVSLFLYLNKPQDLTFKIQMYNSNPSQTEDSCKKYNDAANGLLGSSLEE